MSNLNDAVSYLLMHQTGPHPMVPRWVPVERRPGLWDVALVIDGGYMSREDAEEMAATWDENLLRVLRELR